MAPFRGRGHGGRIGRGGRGGRAAIASRGTGRLARSGIKTRSGYKKFDSQRVKEVDESEDEHPIVAQEDPDSTGHDELSDEEDIEEIKPSVKSYNTLLQLFHRPDDGERKAKRRKIEGVQVLESQHEGHEVDEALAEDEEGLEDGQQDEVSELAEAVHDADPRDPFEMHFANPDDNDLLQRLKAIQATHWSHQKGQLGKHLNLMVTLPGCIKHDGSDKGSFKALTDLPLKERLRRNFRQKDTYLLSTDLVRHVASCLFGYQDLALANRNSSNAGALRELACLHAVNHVLKGRDKVLKNNERLMHTDAPESVEAQDQGFVRPKVLILLETRQMAVRYADAIVEFFQPEQQENRKRFNDSFAGPSNDRGTMPEDYRELFGGNNDNSFLTALKFTRKTLKFYSAFYNSDIILASPLGLRRIIENEDAKKRDYDFLSSIEIAVIDQADAMQMQNWENVEIVLKHLNLELKETHGADFSRVRPWYLDGNAKYLRQTILFSAYLSPEMNKLYNTSMLNIAGKVKITETYPGAIIETSGLEIKQTFSRFDCPSPSNDPNARFKFFTTAILPNLLRIVKPAKEDGGLGILVFIPSYYDFLRLRNYFATSDQTANISFGAIHDYSEVSDQRRARSHFLNGRHTFLLYTQRAHHFFRLKLRGVKRVVMYGLPDNPIFYREIVEGSLGSTVQEGRISPAEAAVRCAFSRWDGLKLERTIGSGRVKNMLGGVGDTFDFV